MCVATVVTGGRRPDTADRQRFAMAAGMRFSGLALSVASGQVG